MQQTDLLKAATQARARCAEMIHKGLSAKKGFHLADSGEEKRSDVVEVRACHVSQWGGGLRDR